jgi:hypothetical protein
MLGARVRTEIWSASSSMKAKMVGYAFKDGWDGLSEWFGWSRGCCVVLGVVLDGAWWWSFEGLEKGSTSRSRMIFPCADVQLGSTPRPTVRTP